jgi:2',3'-cyclic-nucleotide 2'-phosphodiesterase (5'-nucleotidase family)
MKGPITVADIYQLVPFDNRLVVLTMSGEQIVSLVRTLAEKGGEPYGGLTYAMMPSRDHIVDVRIGDQAIDDDRLYQLVTVDYLASIGREFSILQEAASRVDDTTFLRDAVIAYIREQGQITPTLDGRVVDEPLK